MKGLFLGFATKTTRDKAPYSEERTVSAVSTERIKEWKRSELGENEDSSRETSYDGYQRVCVGVLCGCDCVGDKGSVWVWQP